MPINDSTSEQILDTLRTPVSSDIFVINLESGHAWWENAIGGVVRGAVRLRHPSSPVTTASLGAGSTAAPTLRGRPTRCWR